MKPINILAIVGPTAVGKTEFAIMLAKQFDGEIISADSMQIYQRLTIGTAKPNEEERLAATHHLVDCVDPAHAWSVVDYQREAMRCIEDVASRGKLPVISGGTGLYVNSLLYQMDFSSPKGSSEVREKLEQEAAAYGNQSLHDKLRILDPAAAQRIHPNNLKKLIRAVEVASTSEKGIPDFQESLKYNDRYNFILIGLDRDREELYQRIDKRVEAFLGAGLVEEVRQLLASGLTLDNTSLQGIGYKEIIPLVNGEYDEAEALRLIQRNSRNYAKRQLTWFRRYENIRWFNLTNARSREAILDEMIRYVESELSSKDGEIHGRQ